MSIKNLSAKQIKTQYNGITKKLFVDILKKNGVKIAPNQTPNQYLMSADVRNAITGSDQYKEAKEKYTHRMERVRTRDNRMKAKEAAARKIKLNDRLGYDKPVVLPISKFSDFDRYRVAYNRQDHSNVREMYDNLVNFKKDHVNKQNKVHSMVFYIKDRNAPNGKTLRCITVPSAAADAENFDEFMELIEDMTAGVNDKDIGSDQVNPQTEYIDFSRFDIYTKKRKIMKGLDSIKLFKTVGIDGGSKGLCVYYCLQRILGDNFMTVDEFKQRSLNELEGLAEWIKDNKHNINLILTTPKLTDELFDESPDNLFRVKLGKYRSSIYRASIENARYIYPYGCFFPYSDKTILIDIDNNHADLPFDNIVQMNQFYFTKDGRYFLKNEKDEYEQISYSEKQLYEEGKRITQNILKENIINDKPQVNGLINAEVIEECFIFYDYETITDFSLDNPIVPVSLAFVEMSKNGFENMSNLNDDFIINLKEIKKRIHVHHGRDCTKFLDAYITENRNKVYTLVSFNGARFDHYILYNELTRPDMRNSTNIANVFFVKNDLLNFTIDRRHSLFDLCKHIKSSLEDACRDYGIDIAIAKKKINFFEIQHLYDTLGLDKFIEAISSKETEQSISYNKYIKHDIISMIAVMYKYNKAIINILKIKNISEHKTSGGMMTTVLNNHIHDLHVKLPIFKKEQAQLYKDLKRSQVGGKVDLINGIQKLFEQIYSIDCSGMYPYVMAVLDVYYPCGDIVEIDSYDKLPPNKIGFFYCSYIDQSHLKVKVHPKKVNKSNDWHTNDIINDVVLSTVRIDMLKKEGCPITIGKGFYFTQRIKSCDLFRFILDFMKLKTEQDILKENKDPKYNESLRATVKELMLILSGKLAEGLYLNKLIVVDEATFNNEYRCNKDVEFSSILPNGNAVIKLAVSEAQALKHSKPIYISTLIYDYAQQYMRDMLWNRAILEHLLYCDTDSLKMTRAAFEQWSQWALTQSVPHWPEVEKYDPRYKTSKLFAENNMQKVIGSFVDEYKNKEIDISYWLAKKRYFVGNTDLSKNGDFKTNFKFNGIKPTDLFINDIDQVVKCKNMTSKDLFYFYHEKQDQLSIKNTFISFLDCLFNRQPCHILVSSITKDKKNICLTSNVYLRQIV